MIALRYLRRDQVGPDARFTPMLQNPEPFIIRPQDFYVVDGDTLSAMMPPDSEGKSKSGFSMRFRTINAPEKKRSTRIEQAFARMGAPSGITRGDLAAEYLKKKMKNHAVMIVPAVDPQTGQAKLDRHNRLIADIYISGTPGPQFDIANAESAQDLLVSHGYGSLNFSEKQAPSRALDAVRGRARMINRSHEEQETPSM